MVLNLHHCQLKHLDLLVEISKETFIQAFKKHNNPDDFRMYVEKAFAESTLKNELLDKHSHFFLVYCEQVLVGYFKINEFGAQSEFKDASGMELERLYVLRDHQNKGIGSHLLQKIIKIVQQYGKKYLWLGVWEENKKAIKFYQQHGFEKIGTHPYFIGSDKQTDWLMRFNI